MTRNEVAKRVADISERGYKVQNEIAYENVKIRLFASHTGYKWLVEYTKNDKGVFTASDIRLFDFITEALKGNSTYGKFIYYKSYPI